MPPSSIGDNRSVDGDKGGALSNPDFLSEPPSSHFEKNEASLLAQEENLSDFSKNLVENFQTITRGDYTVEMIDGMVFGRGLGGHQNRMILTISNHPDRKRRVEFSRPYMTSGIGPSMTLQYIRDHLGTKKAERS